MSDQPAASPTPSRRQAARLAAVQALYQWQEGEHAPAEIIEQFLSVRTGETGEGGLRRDDRLPSAFACPDRRPEAIAQAKCYLEICVQI